MIRFAWAILVLAWGAAGAQAASFACANARATDEKAVCVSRRLSDLDVRLATLFEVSTQLVAMGQRAQLQEEQRVFLVRRAACGADTPCLTQAYEERILRLEAVLKSIYERGPY